MVLRLLFVLLMALNIAVGAWLVLGQPYARGGVASDPGVPELRLLSELPDSAAPATSAMVPVAAPVSVSSAARVPVPACLTLGPFATHQDLRDARKALAGEVSRMRSRQEQASQTSGWWVYLPATDSHEQALAQARLLDQHHISDYFVVSSGDQINTISLGLFKDPANAHHRLDTVAAAGFPARLTERTENVPQYWLDLVVADHTRFDWRRRVRGDGVGSHTAGCF